MFDKIKLKFYEGHFNNDVKEGTGRSYIISGENRGNLYQGSFINDKYHGEGRYLWPDGDEYKGNFRENL